MIYLFDRLDTCSTEFLEQAFFYLPLTRQNKVNQQIHPKQKKLSILSLFLLQYGLKDEYHLTTLPDIAHTKHGKPYLSEHPDIHFNISHCPCAVACAISSNPIGLDLQDIARANRPNTWRRVCSPTELLALQQSASPEQLFARFWSLKESYVKYTGQGIQSFNELQKLSFAEYIESIFFYRQVTFYTKQHPLYMLAACSPRQSSDPILISIRDLSSLLIHR